jgi:hypothetical protein
MGSEDHTRLRVQNQDTLKSDYVTATKSLQLPSVAYGQRSSFFASSVVEASSAVFLVIFAAKLDVHHTRQIR